MQSSTEKSVFDLVAPIAGSLGCELVDVELTTDEGQRILRVSIAKPDGVTVEDCSRVSGAIEDVIEVKGCVPGRYHLEVSSPGLDRPLRSKAHFESVLGKVVRVATKNPINGRQNFKGVLHAVSGNDLGIVIDNQTHQVPLDLVKKARLVF